MKISVSTYSFKNIKHFDCIKHTAEMGFDGIEYTDGFWVDKGLDCAYAIKECCEKNGIELVLQFTDGVGNGRLRDIQLFRGSADTVVFADGLKIAKLV